MSKKAELYNDLHPKTSLKNTGFKDEQKAINTIKLIKSRSLKYQFDVINTMYNRAKYHPNITSSMKKAMKIFKKWLVQHKKLKAKEDIKYPWLSLNKISKYEKLAQEYNMSKITIGEKSSLIFDKDFLQMYKFVKGKKRKLQYIPIKSDKPELMDYWSYRINFIKCCLAQIKKFSIGLFYIDGKYKGYPTKQHVALIMHGFSPCPDKI